MGAHMGQAAEVCGVDGGVGLDLDGDDFSVGAFEDLMLTRKIQLANSDISLC